MGEGGGFVVNIQLTQKERLLLEDQKHHEQLCIQKYNLYSELVQDPQLKQMFKDFAAQEQKHLDTINQILSGQVPSMNQNQQGGQQSQASAQQGSQNQQATNNQQHMKPQECLQDLLMTEKYVSGTYNIAIFEFENPQVRDILNHIQKEEQKHGEAIFQYMRNHNMYNPK